MQTFVMMALATYRLARLFAVDDGPWDFARRLRMAAGAYSYGPDGRPATNLGRLISCPYCTGLYAALFVWALHYSSLPAWVKKPIIEVLGVAGAQALAQSLGKE